MSISINYTGTPETLADFKRSVPIPSGMQVEEFGYTCVVVRDSERPDLALIVTVDAEAEADNLPNDDALRLYDDLQVLEAFEEAIRSDFKVATASLPGGADEWFWDVSAECTEWIGGLACSDLESLFPEIGFTMVKRGGVGAEA